MEERKKITIGVPHHSGLDTRFVISLMTTAMHLTETGYLIDLNFKGGSLIPKQRNSIAENVLKSGYDLLFIDSDMVFGALEVDKILEEDKDIIGGMYYSRRPPHDPLVYSEPENNDYFQNMPEVLLPTEPFVCYGVGTGFLYIKNHVLKKMFEKEFVEKYGQPFNMWQISNGDCLGEDLAFCKRAKIAGFEVWCHPNVV